MLNNKKISIVGSKIQVLAVSGVHVTDIDLAGKTLVPSFRDGRAYFSNFASLVIGHWSLVIGHWSLVHNYCSHRMQVQNILRRLLKWLNNGIQPKTEHSLVGFWATALMTVLLQRTLLNEARSR